MTVKVLRGVVIVFIYMIEGPEDPSNVAGIKNSLSVPKRISSGLLSPVNICDIK